MSAKRQCDPQKYELKEVARGRQDALRALAFPRKGQKASTMPRKGAMRTSSKRERMERGEETGM